MATKSPLARVKEQFSDKAKLVEAIRSLAGDDLWVSRVNESKGLAHVSNAKLLRLHAVFTEVRSSFKTRQELIDALLDIQKRSKDAGLRSKLSAWPVPRLLDAYRSAKRRAGSVSDEPTARPTRGAKSPEGERKAP